MRINYPLSMKTKMALVMSAVFISGIATFGGISLDRLEENQKMVADYQLSVTKHIAEDIDQRISDMASILRVVAKEITIDQINDSASAQRALDSRKGIKSIFFDHGLFLFDMNGNLVASSSLYPEIAATPEFMSGIRSALDNKAPYISDPFELHVPSHDGHILVTFSVPIMDSAGNPIGVYVGCTNTNLASILGKLSQSSKSERDHLFLLSSDWKVISHTQNIARMTGSYPVDEQMVKRVRSGFQGAQESLDNKGQRVLSSFIRLKNTGWILGSNVPLDEAYKPLQKQKHDIYLFMVLGALISALVTWFSLKYLTRPLENLTAQINNTGASSTELAPILVNGSREIDLLGQAFNDLIAKLNANIVVREKTEAALRLNASVFENAYEGIVIADADNIIVSVNKAFTTITGIPANEVIGTNQSFLSTDARAEDFHLSVMESIQKTGGWSGEVWNRKGNGDRYAMRLSVTSVKGENGENSHYISVFSDITDLKTTQHRLEYLDSFDVLTGLPNRALFYERFMQSFASSSQQNTMIAVCFLDLDYFKNVNENYGSEIGDQVLVQVSERIANAIRFEDTAARIGGDEFILLLTGITKMDELQKILERILIDISQPYEVDGKSLAISTSIGVTIYPGDNAGPETLVRHADQAMYKAKQEGRNRFHIFDPAHDQQIHDGYQLAHEIRKGLHRGEMRLYYQPKVNMRTGEVIGMEALLRWQHRIKGLLGPAEFLPIINGHEDLHSEIGEWVIRAALSQLRVWTRLDALQIAVSVNIEACHLMKANFTKRLESILSEFPDISPEYLELEILESAAMHDLHQIRQTIKDCRDLGVTFSLDDFGTGYSSLSYLKHLPVNTLKIDQAFVRDMLHDKCDLAVARGVISMAEVFGLEVIAEGVETPEHGIMLMRLGCDVAQGYGISRPIPAEQVANWVNEYQPYPIWKSSIHTHKDGIQKQGAGARF